MIYLARLALIVLWVIGIVVSKGFWWTLASIFIAPISWYFAVKHFMVYFGVL